MRTLIAAALAAALLAGCARAPEATLSVAGYCDVAKPIFWSAKDTRETKEQVDSENRKWKLLCKKETIK